MLPEKKLVGDIIYCCRFAIMNLLHAYFSEKPNVTINCSTPVTVNVGDDVTCLCEGKGGYPPADVTWYKNEIQIGNTKKKENVLTLSNINKTDSGTYVCVGKSHYLIDKSSIEVLFNGKHV